MRTLCLAGGVLALASFATPAAADTATREMARETQSAVDAYLATAQPDAILVGGPGQAGYDGGFWIRGGSFLLKINLTLQTRWEGYDWDDSEVEPSPGGDLSGFSLPRATLKLSGDATCDVHYYAELEFGHPGTIWQNTSSYMSLMDILWAVNSQPSGPEADDPLRQYGILREGWIEYETSPYAIFRMGLVKTPTTRQLMTPPELQQFVDISLASAHVGNAAPGYSDRNRSYGALLHGAFGCDGEFQYMVSVTNGDAIVHRNVLDGETTDNFAYGVRVNWDVKGHLGYEEGALRSHDCAWAASVGAWAQYLADAEQHNPFVKLGDRLQWGVDGALVWGGLSFTAAYSALTWDTPGGSGLDGDGSSYLVQAGYLFPGTAWEVAARWSAYTQELFYTPGGTELAVAVSYYIDGHADKVTLDAAFLSADDDGNDLADTYAGYHTSRDSDAVLIRLQWQLAL